jgi:hypothetical protein
MTAVMDDLRESLDADLANLEALAADENTAPDDPTIADLQRSIDGKRGRLELMIRTQNDKTAAASLQQQISRVEDLKTEQKAERNTATMGDIFTRSAEYAAYDGRGKTSKVKTDLTLRAVATPMLTTNFPKAVLGGPRYYATPDPQFPLIDVTPIYTVPDSSFPFLTYAFKEGGAAVVPEGDEKPELDLKEVAVDVTLQTIAVRTSFSRQLAEDAPFIRQFINDELRWAVLDEVEDQIVTAITGASSIPTASAPHTGGTLSHALRLGMAKISGGQRAYRGTVALVNPDDAASIQIGQAASASGCTSCDPFWGLRLVESAKITAGTAYVVDPRGLVAFQRGGVDLYLTDSHDDHFAKNILDALAEIRFKAIVANAAAFAKVNVASS